MNGAGTVRVQATAVGYTTVKSNEITITTISISIRGDNTVTAKKAVNVTVYYTTSDSNFNTQSQSKSGNLHWTINGGTQSSDSDTSNKYGRTAYAVNISLSANDVLVLTSSNNRLVIFGVVAEA